MTARTRATRPGGVDTSVAIGGLTLRGPVMAASGTFGYGTEVPLLERRALGAIVSKGIFL